MRGFFAIGVERVSKPMNLGNLMRSAHAFGASFVYTVNAHFDPTSVQSNTSDFSSHLPLYHWKDGHEMQLPEGCKLVGIELLDEAVQLPSFRHPPKAAYILGPERGSLSPEIVERCDHIVKIPTAFCINVAMAGAIVMYDRIKSRGGFPTPPVSSAAPKPTEI